MKQRGVMVAVLAAVLLTGVAITVAAQDGAQGPPPFGREHGPRGFGGPMGGPGLFGLPGLRELDLTDAQKDQIKTIVESHRAEMQQVAEKTRTAQRAIDTASDGGTVDEAAIRSNSTQLAAAIADGAILRAKVNAEIFNVLTAEQQQKIQERRAQMQERRRRQ